MRNALASHAATAALASLVTCCVLAPVNYLVVQVSDPTKPGTVPE